LEERRDRVSFVVRDGLWYTPRRWLKIMEFNLDVDDAVDDML
jgi:hypothetical protein